MPRNARVLAYHSLTVDPRDPLGVAPETFRRQMEWLARDGWRCLSLTDLLAMVEEGREPSDRSFVMTFDDGFVDNLEVAAPILRDHGWTATVFLVTDALEDGRPREHGRLLPPESPGSERRSFRWEDAERWCRLGFTIGSHTRTHRMLTRIDPRMRQEELVGSASALRKQLGIESPLLCYPYGDVDGAVIEAARSAGYRGGVVTPRVAGIPFSRWTIHRVGIYGHDGLSRFRFKLGSLFPILRETKLRVRRRRAQIVPVRKETAPCVLHVTSSSQLGGIECMLSRLVPELKGRGLGGEVLLLERGGLAIPYLQEHGVRTHALLRSDALGQLLGLRSLVRTGRFDVLHSYGTRAMVLTRLSVASLRSRRTKVVSGIHSVNHGRGLVRGVVDRLTRCWNDLYVADCRAAAAAASRRLSIAPDDVSVVPMGLEGSREHPREARAGVRASLGFADTDPVLICVANLRPMKGHRTLFRAFGEVLRAWPRCRLLLVGTDHMGGVLQREAAGLFRSDQVLFLGFRKDVDDLLAASDLFVIASDWEGLCVANLEAMRAGLPIVATSVGGIPEAVRDGVEGLLVAPRDAEALAGAITSLLADRRRAQRMGRAARERRRAEYTIERMAGQLAGVYAELIGQERPAEIEGESRKVA